MMHISNIVRQTLAILRARQNEFRQHPLALVYCGYFRLDKNSTKFAINLASFVCLFSLMFLSAWSWNAWGDDDKQKVPANQTVPEKSEAKVPFYGILTREERRGLIKRLKKVEEVKRLNRPEDDHWKMNRLWSKLYLSLVLDKERAAEALDCSQELQSIKKENKDPEVDSIIFMSLIFIIEHPDVGADFEKKLFDEYRNAENDRKTQLLEALLMTKWVREEQRFEYFLEMYKDVQSSDKVRKDIIGSISFAAMSGRIRIKTFVRWYRELASLPITSPELAKQMTGNLGDILEISDDRFRLTKNFEKMREVNESIKQEMVDPER